MIQLKELSKAYKTGDFVQKALDGVSLNLRDNEFVAVLGPSGSGKTTLLNILGGLDRADSGEIIINGRSTKKYRSADWDTYRNHEIGFIFQSYNLIPHQSVIGNVELALTLAGVGRSERRRRAAKALERVGLADHINKKPNQLSGGQMQRVAIARALVNDPSILLADEPTGALDTETGLAVMELLSEIAQDRLVVMVTHNPELAEQYATRIVTLADGRITSDSDPLEIDGVVPADALGLASSSAAAGASSMGKHAAAPAGAGAAGVAGSSRAGAGAGTGATARTSKAPGRKASMSFLTALALSFKNLMTKKGRTFMTAFAGSIGIIGIAAILSLSNGVNNYIADTEEQALTSYPLTITKSSFDLASLFGSSMGVEDDEGEEEESNAARGWRVGIQGEEDTSSTASHEGGRIVEIPIMTDMFAQVKNNNLAPFKTFLDSDESGIDPYVHTIQYTYGVIPQVYMTDTSKRVTKLNPSSMGMTLSGGVDASAFGFSGTGQDMFTEMMDNRALLESYMDVVAGRWPEKYDEALLVLSSTGRITDYTLYSIGYYNPEIMDKMTEDTLNGKEVTAPETAQDFTLDKALELEFSVVPSSNLYHYNAEQKIWTDMSSDTKVMKDKVNEGIRLKVVGVVQPSPDVNSNAMRQGIAYTPELTEHLMKIAAESEIVKQQEADRDRDVFTGKTFEELRDEEGADFDLESMFDVDEEALQNAFSFDTSALDFSSMSFDPSALEFDASSMNIDPNALSNALDTDAISQVFNEQSMRQMMSNAPEFKLEDSGIVDPETQLTEEQQELLNAATDELSADFIAWGVANGKFNIAGGIPGAPAAPFDPTDPAAAEAIESGEAAAQPDFAALFGEYLQTESAQAILEPLGEEVGAEFEKRLNTAMQNYMTNQFAPYMSSAMQTLMTQAAQTMALQMGQALQAQMAAATSSLGAQLSSAISGQLQGQLGQLQDALSGGFSFDADAFANAINFNMSQEDLTSLLTSYLNADELSYEANLKKLGFAKETEPESVSIYPIDFESKEQVLRIIDNYNASMQKAGKEDSAIQYSDFAGVLMSSVTDIIDAISLVLIAFVSISLVVSSIMIGIITYISVLERKKEIGILRAMGASKRNIANVFNAETFIEGLFAGVLAIAVVLAASVPVNRFVEAGWGVPNIMSLPWSSALALIGVSIVLTFIAGLIPSQSASRRDPVEALRSE